MSAPPNLYEYGPALRQIDVQRILDVSEHGVRQLRVEGRLSPIKVGSRLVFPRWQIFKLLGLVDPDVAVARAAAEVAAEQVVTNGETTPSGMLSAVPSHDPVELPETQFGETTL
jgi:hypothetical protein